MLHIFLSSLLQISLVKNYVTDYTNAQISKKEKKNKEKNRNANSLLILLAKTVAKLHNQMFEFDVHRSSFDLNFVAC